MQDDNGNESIVDKIEKLLALANASSATVAEAESAMLLAQRIALKHNIEISSLGHRGPKQDSLFEQVVGLGLVRRDSRKRILSTLCRNFRCELLMFTDQDTHILVGCTILGLEDEVKAVGTLFMYLVDVGDNELRRYILENLDGIGTAVSARDRVRDSWSEGYALGIDHRFKEQVSTVPGMSLMLTQPDILKQAMEQLQPAKHALYAPLAGDADEHAYHGYVTGKNTGDPNAGLLSHDND